MEFSYNNRYHNSIGMSPFQALYSHPFHTPLSWDQLEDRVCLGSELLCEMEQQVEQIHGYLVAAQDRQKYADAHRVSL